MKFINYLPAVLLTAAVATSCNDSKKEDTTVSTDTSTTTASTTPDATITTVRYAGDGNKTVVTNTDVPAPVSTTFQKKYAKADKVEWVRYDPIAEDNWDMEKDYYFAGRNEKRG
ncbi:MAG: hypothetical protein EOP53_11490 [Sphingobacteriales bacterium]|nr:MAG: hypothetical protein EOP53_11490 [Sphingobacteriales bacterium]